eukprot:Skav200706  [mRNA]  locus=scaffold2650:32015:35201:- [translate_table: standard]
MGLVGLASPNGDEPVPIDVSFFALGGHSLSVGQLVNRIRRELKIPSCCITDVYAAPSVRKLAAKLGESAKEAATSASSESKDLKETAEDPAETHEAHCYVASYQQLSLERMASLSSKASSALNLTFCCHVRGPLDVDLLRRAFIAVQMRHDALRTTLKDGRCHIHADDCLDFCTATQPADLAEWMLNQQYETFDLAQGPLCRVRIIEESSSETQLRRSSPEWQKSLEFWRQKLQSPPPALALPGAEREKNSVDRTSATEIRNDFSGSKVDFELSRDLSEKLCVLSQRFGASLHATLLAAWMVLLSRYAEEDAEDVCVGTPFASRTTGESEEMVGYFVTPLCIRAHVTGNFDALLQQVHREVQNALRFQRVPLNEVCEELNLELRHVLQAMFVFQTCPELGEELPSFLMGHEGSELSLTSELQLESMAIGQRHAQFDLALMMAFSPSQQIIGNFQYSFASYSRETVLRLQSQYQRLLEKVVAEPTQNVTQIQFIDFGDLRLIPRAISPWQEKMD